MTKYIKHTQYLIFDLFSLLDYNDLGDHGRKHQSVIIKSFIWREIRYLKTLCSVLPLRIS